MAVRGRANLITFVESPQVKVQLNWRYVIVQSEDGLSRYIADEVIRKLLAIGVPLAAIKLVTVEQVPLFPQELEELGPLGRHSRIILVDVRVENEEVSPDLKRHVLFYTSSSPEKMRRAEGVLGCPTVHSDAVNRGLDQVKAMLDPASLQWFGTHFDGVEYHTVFITHAKAEGVDVRVLQAMMAERVIRVLIYQSTATVVGIAVIPPVRTVFPGNTSLSIGGAIQGRLSDPAVLDRLHQLYPATITMQGDQE